MTDLDEFIPMQRRCRTLEHRIGRVHDMLKSLPTHRRRRAMLVEERLHKQWRVLKDTMAHEIYKKGEATRWH